jgi:nucleoside-diphosphate-sugar epimerase
LPKRYLVTGGTGFIGRALVQSLIERGDVVRSLDDDSRGSRKWFAETSNVELITGDIRNPEIVNMAAKGIDCVVHLAFINGTDAFYKKPGVILDVAVRGISNVIDACITNGVPELSLASSSEVYQTAPTVPTDENVPLSIPDPLNPRYSYAGGKIISELMALNFAKYFQKVTVFRPHNIYGPNMGDAHVIPQLVERVRNLDGNLLPIQGTGNETRSFCYIEDAIHGILAVMDRGTHRGIYNVGTEEEVSIKTLVAKIGQQFGREIDVIPGDLQPGSTLRRCPDIRKLRALGYEPRTTLDEGLEKVCQSPSDVCLPVPVSPSLAGSLSS